MIRFLDYCSKRWGYDGWALKIGGSVLSWSACTTREEARDLKKALPDMFNNADIVKVKITVEEVK